MARLKDLAVGSKDAFLFDPEMIEEKESYNVRDMSSPETQAHIRRMADAIHAGGTASFPPITVHQEDGKIYVVSGYCRRRAHILARKEGSPIKGILAIANNQDEAERTLDLLNSNDGLPLTPLEQAKAVQRLLSFDWSVVEIAKRRGWSVSHVSDLILLLKAPLKIKDMVQKGDVSATTAIRTIRQRKAMAPQVLADAVDTAKARGKTRVTAKHIPTVKKEIQTEIPSGVDELLPRLTRFISKVRDAESIKELQQLQIDARTLLTNL
jgi:ParB family transcriptional regulator, chromosome partitioning protein